MTGHSQYTDGARGSAGEVFRAFLKLGLTSFGGPVAHLSYFRNEFVVRRKWLGESEYADVVALCQFLPGPASSQVGMTLGIARAGLLGAFAAWCGFTLPSAAAMILFAYGVALMRDAAHAPWLHGLNIVAVAVVAQAVWAMARALCPDALRATIAVAAALFILAVPLPLAQIAVIAGGGAVGWLLLRRLEIPKPGHLRFAVPRGAAIASLLLFFALLTGLPFLAQDHALALFASFYRSGALVFGGGHVVLPLLQQAVVPQGWISNGAFLAGYGAAQAVPGPLFTFAAYLGAAMRDAPNGWIGGALCLVAIFLPSFLLLVGVLPFWDRLRAIAPVRRAMAGVNAAVVGLLLAALYTPVWTSAILSPLDFALALAAFLLLAVWKLPPWIVVLFGAVGASALSLI